MYVSVQSVVLAGMMSLLLAACASDDARDPFPEQWHRQLTGVYDGTLISGGKEERVTTRLLSQPDGRVVGVYFFTVRDSNDTGSLTDCRADGFGDLSCIWTDKFGSGPVRLKFSDDLDRFSGTWGTTELKPDYFWNGKRN
ncbi:MAG: hypothetical protein RIC36_17490 [Rhodospirillales bacterium]